MSVAAEPRPLPQTSIFNDPKVRAVAIQVIVVLLVAWFAWEMIHNTITNLRDRNIASGFGFLNTTAGFDLSQHLIEYSETSTYGRAILVGFLNTLLIAALGVVLATIIGFVVGIMRLSRNWLVAKIAEVYVEVIRNVPLLLQIFIWYHAVLKPLPQPRQGINILDSIFLSNRGFIFPRPIFEPGAEWAGLAGLIGIGAAIYVARWARLRQEKTGEQFPTFWASLGLIVGLPLVVFILAGWPVEWNYPELKGFNFVGGINIVPEFTALLVALSIYTASFIAEIVRAGILAVSHGQSEAAHALGIRPGLTLRLVVIPQAMRVIIPPLASQYLNLTKNSSLAVAIAYPDLVAAGGTVLNQTGQAVEIIGIWMFVYLSLSLVTSGFMNWFNARVRLVER